MCGKCIEGCYLAGWRNGVYSFEHMQEDPDFMGKDVKAAHGAYSVLLEQPFRFYLNTSDQRIVG